MKTKSTLLSLFALTSFLFPICGLADSNNTKDKAGESVESALENQSSTSKWAGSVSSSSMTWLKDQQTYGANAPIGADQYVAVDYKLTDKLVLEVGYNFTLMNNNLYAYQPYYPNSGYISQDPQITLKQTLGTIGASEPVNLWYTLYLPASNIDRTVRGGYGILRLDASTTFLLPGRWAVMPWETARIYLNNANDSLGTASVYRLTLGGALVYNFTKAFNAYAWPQLDLRSTDVNYGTLRFNVMNRYQTELGVSYTVKAGKSDITINPAIINYVYLDSGMGLGQASYATTDPSGYNPTLELDFNVAATF